MLTKIPDYEWLFPIITPPEDLTLCGIGDHSDDECQAAVLSGAPCLDKIAEQRHT